MFCSLYTGPCPPGMEAHTAVCQPCPVGKYRDSLELTDCLDCPYGMSTLGTHSRNQSECLGMCFIYQNNKHYFKIIEIEDLTWLIISCEVMMSVRFCLLSVCFSNDFVVLKIEICFSRKIIVVTEGIMMLCPKWPTVIYCIYCMVIQFLARLNKVHGELLYYPRRRR